MKNKTDLPSLAGLDLSAALQELTEENVADRLWQKDPMLWKSDPVVKESIRHRLGWLDMPAAMSLLVEEFNAYAHQARKAGFKDAVLLGMGGSSLCPEVLRQTFGTKKGWLRLHVLDTTDPAAIRDVLKKIKLPKTLFIVSSKSGGTIEVMSLFRFFWAKLQKASKGPTGRHFVAVTDPGTSLERLARDRAFSRIFLSPPDVGGRFSALTPFGLLPAALIGLDLVKFLNRADLMAKACGADQALADNPGLLLGAVLGAAVDAGRNKLTIIPAPEIQAFGLWAEQLIAESTGKEGTGIVPVEGEPLGNVDAYNKDRLFVYLQVGRKKIVPLEKKLAALEAAGHPVFRLELADTYDLAGEFFRWEMATAVAGQLMGINPFDEPNVSESKANTTRILAQFEAAKALPEDPPQVSGNGVKVWTTGFKGKSADAAAALSQLLATAKPGDYAAVMAYVNADKPKQTALRNLRLKAGSFSRLATTLGYGPRFLHSTGQLHKGGPATGIFVQVTAEDPVDFEIPEAGYGFSVLKMAQALGDFQSLREHGRRAVRLHFAGPLPAGLSKVAAKLRAAVPA